MGHLEEYLNKNKRVFVIQTYDDYFEVLNSKFPGRFLRSTKKIEIENRDSKRVYHRIQDAAFNELLVRSGYIPLDQLLDCEISDWVEGRQKIKLITEQLGTNSKQKPYISILCRKRLIDPDRNLTVEVWMGIIEAIQKEYPDKVLVFHGLKEETLEISNSLFCSNIIESIYYLNKSLFFVSSMSGFAQFASNCSCSILQIGPSRQMIAYNPFNKINLQLDRSEVGLIKSYIKQFCVN